MKRLDKFVALCLVFSLLVSGVCEAKSKTVTLPSDYIIMTKVHKTVEGDSIIIDGKKMVYYLMSCLENDETKKLGYNGGFFLFWDKKLYKKAVKAKKNGKDFKITYKKITKNSSDYKKLRRIMEYSNRNIMTFVPIDYGEEISRYNRITKIKFK